MALSLKDPETDRLARALAALTGETLTEAIRRALAERLERERIRRGHPGGLAGRSARSANSAPRCLTWPHLRRTLGLGVMPRVSPASRLNETPRKRTNSALEVCDGQF
jgi:hypothetical protein